MTDRIDIRRVNVEFLRPGPSHNQLLSPYTQYLAVCNDAGAAVVTVPYEHRVFERRLKELRYETGDQSDRLEMLHEIGRDMGRLLESVPGFTGALMNDAMRPGTLVHLRVTLSAAELALLPFELAEVPVGSAGAAVSIQARPMVSITRHIRTVSSEGTSWPDRPRILFISGDPDNVPVQEHRAALLAAIRPFQYPGRSDVSTEPRAGLERFGTLLTIMVNPTLIELQRECEANAYTHIHVLTHGDVAEMTQDSYGLVLRDENGSADVVSGERFVSAITRVDHRPAVVTIASCDSGNVGSVIIPGASFVHAIHQAGVPFVLGAQFPLSKDGSVPLTSRLYDGLLRGEHPLWVVKQARSELHARYNTNWHDWASVVVYEALPPDLDVQLDALRYAQARRATDAALEGIDRYVSGTAAAAKALDSPKALADAVQDAVDRMPLDGQFAVECMGLRASVRKRLSQAAFTVMQRTPGERHAPLGDPHDLLDQARLDYDRAARALLMNDARALQRKATLHWVLVQFVSLSTVLRQTLDAGEWEAACLAATHYRRHVDLEERAWAHASLAELWMLRLATQASDQDCRRYRELAREHAEELNRLYPGVDDFPIKSTRRQLERYVNWWGSEQFQREADVVAAWTRPGGLIESAKECAAILKRRTERAVTPDTPSPPSGSSPSGSKQGGSTTGAKAASKQKAVKAQTLEPAARRKPFFVVEALPAGHGDCLWIEYGDRSKRYRWLIDCGTQGSAKSLLARVEQLPANERFLELFILSHIDSDHIGGALPFFKAVKRGLRFGDVWFNGWRHISGQLGARQGEMFSTAIQDFELPWNVWRDGRTVMVDDGDLPEHVLPGGMTLTLLSPTRAQLDKLKPIWMRELKRYGLEPGGRVDYSRMLRGTPSTKADAAALADIDGLADTKFGGDNGAPNGTSIAVLAEYAGASVLLAADAHAPVLVSSIQKLLARRGQRKLKLDLFKVSHHGSQNNVSTELTQLLECPRYLISTNGDHFFHPDRQAMARILKYGGSEKTVYFNYNCRLNDVWGDKTLDHLRKKYKYSAVYPPVDRPGIVVPLL